MNELNVFVSVGGTANDAQEAFVLAVERRLRAEGLVPHTVGRNTFSNDAPLKTVIELLDNCVGTVVIALERSYFPSGLDKRGGPKEATLSDVRLPTPWNQIEAAMAFSRGHPLMVIVEHGLKSEGLLERGSEWYVQWVKAEEAALGTTEFNGILASWKQKMQQPPKLAQARKSLSEMTLVELFGALKPAELWKLLGAIAVLVGGAFALGGKLFGN